MVNFRQNLYTEEHDFKVEKRRSVAPPGDVPRSTDISGIEVRLKNVLVKDNNTPAIFPFPGYAKLYFLNVVASTTGGDPIRLNLKGFEKVDDGDALNVDKTLFYWKREQATDVAPGQIHVFTSLVKSKQPLRDVASVLSEVQRDSSYKLLTSTLDALLKSSTPVGDISNLVFNLAGVISKYLGKVDDKPLFSWFQSFTDINGDFDVLGKTEKSAGNRYASCELSLVIRDKVRMEEEAQLERTDWRSTTGNLRLFV